MAGGTFEDAFASHLAAAWTCRVRVINWGYWSVGGLEDNDWKTLTVDSTDRALTRAILNTWCDRFPSGWIGRRLLPLFLDAGLDGVLSHPKTLVSSDLGVADRVFSFFATAEGLVHAGTISHADAERWMGELRAADTDGRFFTSYTGFLVSGNRPVS